MKVKLMQFIEENELSPFNKTKTSLKSLKTIYKTRDAKVVHNKLLQKIAQNFVFADTSNLFNYFYLGVGFEYLKKRQEFFKSISKFENNFLKELNFPRENWSPKYDVLVVTEDSDIFNELKSKGCPCKLLVSENDIVSLQEIDLVQVLECNEFALALEQLPQAVFLNSIDEAYLERYLEILSSWKTNIQLLKNNDVLEDIQDIVKKLFSMFNLISEDEIVDLSYDEVEKKVEEINEKINEKIKQLTISGESVVALLNKKAIPEQLKQVIEEAVFESKIPKQVLNLEIPVSIDEVELNKYIKDYNSNKFSKVAEEIKMHSNDLMKIPNQLDSLKNELLFFDFIAGISKFVEGEMKFPLIEDELQIYISKNLLIDNAEPVSFHLNQEIKCSVLTGANSGGKTTLIEHVIQLISLSQIGLPVFGNVKIPLFTDVYYFAKNKGAMNKGAFENLLNQMSGINPGERTLILADEIEAVTEPGVAGNIIAATANYYIQKNCFLIIATHLGHEIKKILPKRTRIDGIEAKGLDENFELIVDHNPVLGRLANSTPELIVEKMAMNEKTDYFVFLNEFLKDNNKL